MRGLYLPIAQGCSGRQQGRCNRIFCRLAVALLKSVGMEEDQMTPAMIEQAMAVNDEFVARLEAIRDAAQGIN